MRWRWRGHDGDVSSGSSERLVLGGTGFAVGILAGLVSFLSWDRSHQIAGVVSGLISVAALGLSVWVAVAGPANTGSEQG